MQASVFFFRALLLIGFIFIFTGCQWGYLIQAADGQYRLIEKKVSFEKVLQDPSVDDETKRKIRLVQEVKKFSENEIKLVHTKNYNHFVQLDDKYVTYAVTASPQNSITPYLWSFPIVGKVPYKGFFKKKGAEEEASELKKNNYDVIVRGVSAYSTLGWFSDPLLSSMTADDDATLVETIIHETTHATVFIKSGVDFNERLATFVGQKGMELFFIQKEGAGSPTLANAKAINSDTETFLSFIRSEIKNMDEFYSKNQNSLQLLEDREKEFQKIKERFKTQCQPKLKTTQFGFFKEMKLNNAVLLNYKIYYNHLDIFENLYAKSKKDWTIFFKRLDGIKNSDHPEEDLKKLLANP